MGLYKHQENYLEAADKLVYAGLAFLTVGMLTGAIWAKAAWGHYWSWDPKETWAAVTWTKLFAVCTSALVPQEYSACAILDTDCVFPFATDVLVWSELPSCRTAKRTFIQPFLAF